MKEAKIVIKNETGLHARPAATVVSEASKFKSNITVKKGEKEINLKSLLGLLSLGVCKNEEIVVKADGQDEEEAVAKIKSIIENLQD